MTRLRAAAATVLVAALLAGTPATAAADVIRDLEYWLDDYGIREAWNTTTGEGVKIAIIDTGVDSSHPDLAGAVVGGADFSGVGSPDGQRPVGTASSSHGTMVASLAAGRGVGSQGLDGVLGVAPSASVQSISIGFGEGSVDSDDQIANAVRWAVDNGADVINMSLTRNTLDWPESWDDAFLYAMEEDVVIVAAAGNRGSGTVVVGAPATMPGVLTVGGVNRFGEASWDASSQGVTIGVAAPSEELVGALPGGGYATWSGTSGATPIVAGVVALVRAAYPDLDAANVIHRVTATARDVGPPGPDFTYGRGLIDAAAAVAAEVEPVTANPMGDLADWIRIYRRADAVPTATAAPTAPPESSAPPPERTLAGTLYPTLNQLQFVGIPLLVLTGFSTLLIVLLMRAVRQFGMARRTR
ncbi:S8 family serine peptidase [Lysobacter korlensis]|uniref:S8 family serine peptidase n=1 Tax=Lysobacter korlensis TaxID=553636 RepID=A0ABV6RZC4_9GAMM